ncbi:hypothetical protein [Frigoribacterium faeni]|uniref:Uncharacterized protein n=1 Tax=Frigoribacterium faeni TaxID=145483 RepID=A0A7W3JJC7_9MICO|nr:hypothetical protein [Frigoribacterium faeni]MBA8813829.1 hypothetical protein [Frigoribacterium faeni]BFF15147.1 hypothetical protein GCM10025699_64500 [Microbacterium flavescens]GEK82197.1 hypothetical protein FFA01_05060 [Frigoribacterium faeni]
MKSNSPFGRALFLISIVVAIGIVVVMWTVIPDVPLIGRVLFTVFAAGNVLWNARLAYGSDRDR